MTASSFGRQIIRQMVPPVDSSFDADTDSFVVLSNAWIRGLRREKWSLRVRSTRSLSKGAVWWMRADYQGESYSMSVER